MNSKYLYICGLLAFSGLSTSIFAVVVEAKKETEIYASADKSATVLHKLKIGDALEAKERKGMYWQVQMKDGKTGFVSILAVKHKAESGSLENALKKASQDGKKDSGQEASRSRSAVMGVRGLDDSDVAMAGSVKPNLKAVYGMEAQDVSNKEVEEFGEEVVREMQRKSP